MATRVAWSTLYWRYASIQEHALELTTLKHPRLGTLPPGAFALSARFCARMWKTDPQSAALTLKLLRDMGAIVLVADGTRGPGGKPAVYRFPSEEEYEEHTKDRESSPLYAFTNLLPAPPSWQ